MANQLLDLLKKDKDRIKAFYLKERESTISKFNNELQKALEPIDEILAELGSNIPATTNGNLFISNGVGGLVPTPDYETFDKSWQKGQFVFQNKTKAMDMLELYKTVRALDGDPISEDSDYKADYAHFYGDIADKAKKGKIFGRAKDSKLGDKQYLYGLLEWFDGNSPDNLKLKKEYRSK